MPITITLPDTCDFVVQKEKFSHSWTAFGTDHDMIARHVSRAAAHGLKQMVGDATSGLETDELKQAARHKAYGAREKWLNSDPRGPSDDSMWLEEADNVLRLLKVPHKIRVALKTIGECEAALITAGGPIRGVAYARGIDKTVARRRAAMNNPESALAALAALAADDEEEMDEAAE